MVCSSEFSFRAESLHFYHTDTPRLVKLRKKERKMNQSIFLKTMLDKMFLLYQKHKPWIKAVTMI